MSEYSMRVARFLAVGHPHFDREGHAARIDLADEPNTVCEDGYEYSEVTYEPMHVAIFVQVPCTCGEPIMLGFNCEDGKDFGRLIRGICSD